MSPGLKKDVTWPEKNKTQDTNSMNILGALFGPFLGIFWEIPKNSKNVQNNLKNILIMNYALVNRFCIVLEKYAFCYFDPSK